MTIKDRTLAVPAVALSSGSQSFERYTRCATNAPLVTDLRRARLPCLVLAGQRKDLRQLGFCHLLPAIFTSVPFAESADRRLEREVRDSE
jgi:hypothetical protein